MLVAPRGLIQSHGPLVLDAVHTYSKKGSLPEELVIYISKGDIG